MTQQLTPGRTLGATGEAGRDVPQLATGVDLIGEYQASGYKDPPCLVRRSDGQTIQLTPLLYATLQLVDGRRGTAEIAGALGERVGRPVSEDNVRYLVGEKLRPPGLLKDAQGRDPEVRKANPLLSLRLRLELSSERWTNRLAAPFSFLFTPVVVVPACIGFLAVAVWVLGINGVGIGARELLYSPGLMLAALALLVVSAGFHELGHAAGCRYSGGKPGVMGCGLYLVWPAFYTDVTDAYRLNRAGRLRTDLGGLYFNAVFAVATFGAWAVTGVDALLALIPMQLVQMVHQLLPVVRLDGYHILSDLVGVPDLFARIKPTLLALVPGHRGGANASALKPWVRVVVVVWVLAVVPLLLFSLLAAVIALPRVVATTWDSVGLQWHGVGRAFGAGDWLAGLVRVLGAVAVVLPVAATAYMLSRLSRRASSAAWASAGRLRLGRPALAVAGVVAAAGLTFLLWPNGEYRPIQPGERGTLSDAVKAVADIGTGRPGLTPERQEQLGGAPARSPLVGDEPAASEPTPTTAPASGPVTTAPAPSSTTTTAVARSTTTAPPSTSTSLPPSTTTPNG